MIAGIIAVVVFIAIIGTMIFVVLKTMKQTNPATYDTSTNSKVETAQDFLQFDDIRDGMICLGGHQYRAVIECTSTNYNLKTNKEKEMIEASFQRFVNSLTFPVTFYVQTKVIDNSKMLEMMQEELQDVIKNYPHLEPYANSYFYEMSNLHSYIGNNKQKKKYIIVPFDEALSLGNFSDEEKYEYASKELYTRASIIADGLQSVGVKATILNTKELAELIFSTYHKDNYAHVENIVNGEFLTLLTESERNQEEMMTEDARLDWILYEAQMRIQNELLKENSPEFYKKTFEKCIGEINRLRDETGGYYKEPRAEHMIFPDNEDEDGEDEFSERLRMNFKGGN